MYHHSIVEFYDMDELILFDHLSTERLFSYLQFLSIMNKAAMNICAQVFV